MSTIEDRRDDARREAAIDEIVRQYDDAAAAAARGICVRRHKPIYDRAGMSTHANIIVSWTPHTPGNCRLGDQITWRLLEAKYPPRPHMMNPPIVGAEQMVAFTQRVAERFG